MHYSVADWVRGMRACAIQLCTLVSEDFALSTDQQSRRRRGHHGGERFIRQRSCRGKGGGRCMSASRRLVLERADGVRAQAIYFGNAKGGLNHGGAGKGVTSGEDGPDHTHRLLTP